MRSPASAFMSSESTLNHGRLVSVLWQRGPWHTQECTHFLGGEHRAHLGVGARTRLGSVNTIAHSWWPTLFRHPLLRAEVWGSLLSNCTFLITHSLPETTPTSHFPFSPLAQIIASHGSLNIAPSLFSRCGGLNIFLMSLQLPLCNAFLSPSFSPFFSPQYACPLSARLL